METKQGVIKLQLFDKLAPKHVANMIDLVKSGFYDGTYFHRTVSGFMIQGGDPNTKDESYDNDGVGRADLKLIPAEFSKLEHHRGILSAARRGGDVNSATTQFFICHARAASLDGQYTIYGQVVEGMETVDRIVNLPNVNPKNNPRERNPGKEAQIIRVTISE
jgi:peptidyl-prolyl cis-trans isomerase B (cyclophilin B)